MQVLMKNQVKKINESDHYIYMGRKERKKPTETSEILEEDFFPQYVVLLPVH